MSSWTYKSTFSGRSLVADSSFGQRTVRSQLRKAQSGRSSARKVSSIIIPAKERLQLRLRFSGVRNLLNKVDEIATALGIEMIGKAEACERVGDQVFC